MAVYRVRHAIGIAAPTTGSPGSPAPAADPSLTSLGYANLGLPSQLNVDDEDEMNWPEASVEGQSIEEEFNTYDHSMWTHMDQDLLSYWGVSGLLLCVN
jgi:hypothetical protein